MPGYRSPPSPALGRPYDGEDALGACTNEILKARQHLLVPALLDGNGTRLVVVGVWKAAVRDSGVVDGGSW